MNRQRTKLLASFALGTCLLAGNALGSTLFHDAFAGTALDMDKWSTAQQYASPPSVANGHLTLGTTGNSWWANARTVEEFNFHQNSYTVTVDIASFDEPDWASGFGVGGSSNVEFYLSIGPATGRSHFTGPRWDQPATVETTGFHFALRWRQTGLDLYTRAAVGVPGATLSEVPAQAVISLDATDFSISLLDSQGGSIYQSAGQHGITDSLSAYRFSTMYMIGAMGGNGEGPFFSASIDSVTVIPEPSTYAAVLGLLAFGIILYRRRRA